MDIIKKNAQEEVRANQMYIIRDERTKGFVWRGSNPFWGFANQRGSNPTANPKHHNGEPEPANSNPKKCKQFDKPGSREGFVGSPSLWYPYLKF